jgi:hypothetical protein
MPLRAISCYSPAPTSELEPEPEPDSAHFQDIFALGVTLYKITRKAPHDVPCTRDGFADVAAIKRNLHGNTLVQMDELDALIDKMLQPASLLSAGDVEKELGSEYCRVEVKY